MDLFGYNKANFLAAHFKSLVDIMGLCGASLPGKVRQQSKAFGRERNFSLAKELSGLPYEYMQCDGSSTGRKKVK